MSEINDREHRVTGRRPVEMLTEERLRLRQIPDPPHTTTLGVTCQVPANTPMIIFDHCQYSVPASLLGQSE